MSEGKSPPAGRMDRLLAEWPAAPRTALEWDDAAEQVMSHIDSGATPRTADLVSDEDLLRPVLPLSPNEVQSSAAVETRSEATTMSTATRERDRDRASLKDLAKLATAPPPAASSGAFFGTPLPRPASSEPEGKQENSGMIHLGALAAAEQAAPKSAVALPALDREAMSTMRSVAPPPSTKPEVKVKAARKSPWVAMGGVVAAAAVAVGVFFGMQRAQRSAPAAVALATPPAATAAATTPVTTKPATAPAAAPAAPADQGVDPSTLPQAQAAATTSRAPSGSGVARPSGAATAITPAPTVAPTLVASVPPAAAPAPPSSEQSLQNLMQQAAGSSPTATAAAAPAATSDTASDVAPGSVPIKPSQGAIQGALGAALPGARACLGADDPISHATVTFKSDGSVQSVGISGGAAGKPSEACVRSALMKARVAPFAQPTFTASATVRPN